jgi:hypothetical protein
MTRKNATREKVLLWFAVRPPYGIQFYPFVAANLVATERYARGCFGPGAELRWLREVSGGRIAVPMEKMA